MAIDDYFQHFCVWFVHFISEFIWLKYKLIDGRKHVLKKSLYIHEHCYGANSFNNKTVSWTLFTMIRFLLVKLYC